MDTLTNIGSIETGHREPEKIINTLCNKTSLLKINDIIWVLYIHESADNSYFRIKLGENGYVSDKLRLAGEKYEIYYFVIIVNDGVTLEFLDSQLKPTFAKIFCTLVSRHHG